MVKHMVVMSIYVVPIDKFDRAVEIVEEHPCRVMGRLSRRIGDKTRSMAESGDPLSLVLVKLVKSLDDRHTAIIYVCRDDASIEEIENKLEMLEKGEARV